MGGAETILETWRNERPVVEDPVTVTLWHDDVITLREARVNDRALSMAFENFFGSVFCPFAAASSVRGTMKSETVAKVIDIGHCEDRYQDRVLRVWRLGLCVCVCARQRQNDADNKRINV